MGDVSDGSLVYVEVTGSTVTRNSENVYTPLITLGDDNFEGNSNSCSG
ncbi:MAG: hypothetical protein K2H19_03930 [Ruminococcus sp.]|nr:hypothetical protein [Ruminococcus sp.]